ncbi:hypothetical protein CHGG_08578 [Chaetomium globosum CBS 148.51]|uniref:Uncharacterized protein n=1 Tax=Chaetomium globosum (strain ATCC 6205 / CBS 148.51 / DSM 1962 / NBRC 6347 / NRRL 1970) TaxID=306901 RepID=Q2GTX6_CHAGB|nr:uncharacterized protein CHGG_08578 [Chaetomium globosum CBS 148.51]EAQ84564.1 hypothetical protein CHGG_08578 [Chaetomium globosum CBS 148.51]
MQALQDPSIFQSLQGVPCPRLALIQFLSREQPSRPVKLFLRRGQGSADAVEAVEIAILDRSQQCLSEKGVFVPGITKLAGIRRGRMERRVFNEDGVVVSLTSPE